MKIEYDEIQSVYAENIEYEENGKILTANIIKTDYVPTSFKGTTKNFCLREHHYNYEHLHNQFKQKCHQEWLEELGYDTNKFTVDITTNEIVNVKIDGKGIVDVEQNESTKI